MTQLPDLDTVVLDICINVVKTEPCKIDGGNHSLRIVYFERLIILLLVLIIITMMMFVNL